REDLHWYYSKIGRDGNNEQRRRVVPDEKLRAEIQAREQALAELARQAQLQEPNVAWLHNLTSLPVGEVQAVLAHDETLIEYYFDADELKIFLIDRESVTVTQGAGTRGELKELLSELRFQIEKFGYGADNFTAHQEHLLLSIKACLRELYQALFAPIAAQVAGRKL